VLTGEDSLKANSICIDTRMQGVGLNDDRESQLCEVPAFFRQPRSAVVETDPQVVCGVTAVDAIDLQSSCNLHSRKFVELQAHG